MSERLMFLFGGIALQKVAIAVIHTDPTLRSWIDFCVGLPFIGWKEKIWPSFCYIKFPDLIDITCVRITGQQ